MSSQLREVNLDRNNTNSRKIMTKGEVKDYEESKREYINYINSIASLLQQHNEKIAPIVQSYQSRKNGGI